MITTKQNFDRFKGDSYPIKITLNKNKSEALDITGATITLKVATAVGTSIEKTFNAVILEPLNGIAEFQFLTTSFDTVGSFKYEIELITSLGVQYTIATGVIKINQDLG